MEASYSRATNGVRIVDGSGQSPEGRARLDELASRCTGDDVIVLCEPGLAGRLLAHALNEPDPDTYGTLSARCSASLLIARLRETEHEDLADYADAVERSVTANPPEAVVTLHAKGVVLGVLHYQRPAKAGH